MVSMGIPVVSTMVWRRIPLGWVPYAAAIVRPRTAKVASVICCGTLYAIGLWWGSLAVAVRRGWMGKWLDVMRVEGKVIEIGNLRKIIRPLEI